MSPYAFTINFWKRGILFYSLDTDTLHCHEKKRCMGLNKTSLQHWSSTVIDFSWSSLPQSCLQRQQQEISTLEVHMLFLHVTGWPGPEMQVHSSHTWDLPGGLACGQKRCSWWEKKVYEKRLYFICWAGGVRRRHPGLTSWDLLLPEGNLLLTPNVNNLWLPSHSASDSEPPLQHISLE